jgi:hypothetical protein
MTIQHITRDFALNLLNDIVKDEGADTTAKCRYTDPFDNVPVCIVGHALFRLGVPLAAIALHEGESADHVLSTFEELGYFEVDEDAADLLNEAQTKQDNGAPWGDAVAMASEALDTYGAYPGTF